MLFLQSKSDTSEQHGALVEEFLNIRVPTEAQFTEHLLASRSVRNMKNTAVYIVLLKKSNYCFYFFNLDLRNTISLS